MKRSVRALLVTVAVALAVGSVPAVSGAASAKPEPNRAILRAIL